MSIVEQRRPGTVSISSIINKGTTMHRMLLLITNSVLGAGIHSVLDTVPGWSIRDEAPQAPGEMADLAACLRPDVTVLDATCQSVVDLFQQLGQARVASLGRVIILTLTGLDEESLFFLMKWNVAAHVSAWTLPDELISTLCKVMCGYYLLTSENLRHAPVKAL